MKNAKKMIMVPEIEYETLLSMLNTANPLSREKAQIESQMKKTLNDPKISEDIKAKKISLLSKHRKQIKEQIENRPQRVFIENLPNYASASVPPYLGISQIQKTEPNVFDYSKEEAELEKQRELVKKVRQTRRQKALANMPEAQSGRQKSLTNVSDTDPTRQKSLANVPDTNPGYLFRGPYLNKDYVNNLIDYVTTNKSKFGILDDDSIRTTPSRSQGNYKEIIKYMGTNQKDRPTPPGFMYFYGKLHNDPYFKNLYEKSYQKGFGKKILKVKGLKRIKVTKFVPKIWNKL